MKKALVLILAATAAGCSDSSRPPAAPPPPPKKSDSRAPAQDYLNYKTPPEWVSEEVMDNMRKAHYRIPDRQGKAAPATLTFFNMAAQNEETIVDYWRAKMGGAEAKVSKIEGAASPTTLVDISGTYGGDGATIENARFLGAMVETGGQTWYLRFVGPEATVMGWKDAYVEMLKGMKTIK